MEVCADEFALTTRTITAPAVFGGRVASGKKGPPEVTILTDAACAALARLDKLDAVLHSRIMPSLPCRDPRVSRGATCQGVEKDLRELIEMSEIESRGSSRKTNVVSYFGYCIFDNLPPDNCFLSRTGFSLGGWASNHG